jgi:hypothetical protein
MHLPFRPICIATGEPPIQVRGPDDDAANNGYLLTFDNLSGLSPWLSDALCRLAGGGSFAMRQLYTNHDEVLFQVARPIILNGTEDVITRPDLADRAIFLTLPHVHEQKRQPEKEIWRHFTIGAAAHPGWPVGGGEPRSANPRWCPFRAAAAHG